MLVSSLKHANSQHYPHDSLLVNTCVYSFLCLLRNDSAFRHLGQDFATADAIFVRRQGG